ncbi:MAG: ATP-grasp domain-containing protein [Desulfobacteraceae bacterium]|nr:MAG: ATP-grasp domain-containing protein [Desulfobacteraceae bacterium]
MIILDKPYVSDFLKNEITRHSWPVLDNAVARAELEPSCCRLYDDAGFTRLYVPGITRLYCNSENSIGWIAEHLPHTALPDMINRCKDKVRFRKLLAPMYPDFFFRSVTLREALTLNPRELSFPCIIKPAVGFFSMGVHRVDSHTEWPETLSAIQTELDKVHGLYPDTVMDGSRFIIEACLEGEEYAVDAYFDNQKQPVVLNILHHVFASGKDVSDRVYSTSTDIISRWLAPFTAFLTQVGQHADLHDFPVHLELRVEADGRPVPIEINPMRFAGWCTTDIAFYAWGISPYDYYFNNRKPDWEALTASRAGRLWSIAVAELPAGIAPATVTSVDYEGLAGQFENLREIRRINWREYPVLAMLFPETRIEAAEELNRFLHADLTRYVRT